MPILRLVLSHKIQTLIIVGLILSMVNPASSRTKNILQRSLFRQKLSQKPVEVVIPSNFPGFGVNVYRKQDYPTLEQILPIQFLPNSSPEQAWEGGDQLKKEDSPTVNSHQRGYQTEANEVMDVPQNTLPIQYADNDSNVDKQTSKDNKLANEFIHDYLLESRNLDSIQDNQNQDRQILENIFRSIPQQNEVLPLGKATSVIPSASLNDEISSTHNDLVQPNSAIIPPQLTKLMMAINRRKRVMCHFKICNLGRRRRTLSGQVRGWLS